MTFRPPVRPWTRTDGAWRLIPWIFLAAALAASLFVAFRTPPIQGPDESSHLFRADMVTLGEVMPHRFVDRGHIASGAPVDARLVQMSGIFARLVFHPKVKVRIVDCFFARAIRWDARVEPVDFYNTAIYSPLLYLPAIAGLETGKVIGAPVLASTILARVLSALVSIFLGFAALRLAGEARALMAILMLLPMSTFLFGVVNQDGLTIALTALGAALMTRGVRARRPMTAAELWGASAAFACVGLAKVPYALFGLALLGMETRSRPQRWAAAIMPLLIGVAWAAWMQASVAVVTTAASSVDPGRQLQYLLHHPDVAPSLVVNTLKMRGGNYIREFIGQLGWLDTALPRLFHDLAWIVLGLATIGAAAAGARAIGIRFAAWIVGAAIAVSACVFLALYMSWSPVGGAVVEGVQGRYLLPIAIFLCAVFDVGPQQPVSGVRARLHQFGAGLTLVMGVAALVAMSYALSVRYYA